MNISIAKPFLPKNLYNYLYLRCKPMPMNKTDKEREIGVAELYKRKTGRELDFSNLKLFTEKLQWYKLYYYHPDFSRIVCKYNFKEYIKEKLGDGYTVPLIGAWTSVQSIPWDSFPKSFVLKSNCQSDSKFIMIIKDKDTVCFDEIKRELEDWLKPRKTLINSYCRAYYDVTPMILAEEYIEQIDGQVFDYKFFCFDGEPITFKIDFNRFSYHQANYYDPDLRLLPWGEADLPSDPNYNPLDPDLITEDVIREMFDLARKLAQGFPFVRVDFYYYDHQIKLSEMTFYPGGGFHDITMETEKDWGERFHLPQKSPLGRKFRLELDY